MRVLIAGVLAFLFIMGVISFTQGYFMILSYNFGGIYLLLFGIGLFFLTGIIYFGLKRIMTKR